MKANYNVTGPDRKDLVLHLAQLTGEQPKYLGAPGFFFQVGAYKVSKTGELTGPDDDALLAALRERGYEAELETPSFLLAVPRDQVELSNLRNLLKAKGELLKKALGVEDLPLTVTEEKVSFPWFDRVPTPEEATAYTRLIAALCKMSREQKRIQATERPAANEKYAFRCFLLRLGFIGDEYKRDRKILLKNLTGSAAFRDGARNGGDAE